MSHDYLGIGWSFPIVPREWNATGLPLSAEAARFEESVRQSIWIILSTARGERVMRPEFGCGIHNLMFALDNASTIGLVQHEIEQALLYWEPRINLNSVEVAEEAGGETNRPFLEMEYERYRETEARRRFHLMPHGKRESLRLAALEQGARVAGVPAPQLPPAHADDAVLKQIAESLPTYDAWHTERRAHTAGPALLITIDYIVKATNSRFNVVYPFYLERRLGGGSA
jgi:phage baseplate assembly protein W